MADQVATVASHGATWLLTYLVHSTILLGAAWLLIRVGLVRSPSLRDVVWKTALVGGVLTATAGVARHGWRSAAREIRTVRVTVTRVAPEALSWLGPGAPPHGRAAWPEAVVLLWAGGAALAGALAVRRHLALARALSPLWPAGPRARAAAMAVADTGEPPARLAVSEAVASPCVVGGTVVLPLRCEEEMAPDELQAALAHELAHLARSDEAWRRAGSILSVLLWPQPLNRVALAGMDAAAEDVCDARAAGRTDPRTLARAIQRVACWIVPGAARPDTALARVGSRRISERIRRILYLDPGEAVLSEAAAGPWRPALVALLVLAGAFLPVVPVRGDATTAVFIRRLEEDVGAPGMDADSLVVTVRREAAVPGRLHADEPGPRRPR